jgi:hypothetical protein
MFGKLTGWFNQTPRKVDVVKHLPKNHEARVAQHRRCRAALRAENEKHLSRFWY